MVRQFFHGVSALEGHRIWSQTYDSDPNPVLALETRILSPKIGNLQDKVFLDVACGTGRWLLEAQTRGARVFGVDLSPDMLMRAAKKQGLKGCLALADGRRLPLRAASVDLVVCAFLLGYVNSLGAAIHELARATKPGGSIIISDFHPRGLQKGWKRSFRSGQLNYEIENYPYTTEQLIAAGTSAGLRLNDLLELHFGEPERQIFRRAAKEALFEEACSIPAVLIAEWKRA